MAVDLILADIIQTELSLAAGKVVVYNQGFFAPTDSGLYIVISTGSTKILGSNNRFDMSNAEEKKSLTAYTKLTIELTSKDRTAYDKKELVVMALTSTYSVQKQELNNIKIFRAGDIIDLSFIEGSGPLHRFQVPVIINSLIKSEKTVPYFDKARDREIYIEQ